MVGILTEIPWGSILGPLIFNIFINDLIKVIEKTDICNFADENTLRKWKNHSRMSQAKFVEDSLQKIWRGMVRLKLSSTILLGPFLNTLSKSSPNLSDILSCLEHDISIVSNCFKVNSFKLTSKNFSLWFLDGRKISNISLKLWAHIFSKDKVVLIGMTIEAHIENFVKKH